MRRHASRIDPGDAGGGDDADPILSVEARMEEIAAPLVAVCEATGLRLDDDSPQHHDYLSVNETLERVEGEIKARFTTVRTQH